MILERLKSVRVMTVGSEKSPHKFLFLLMLARLYKENPLRNRFISLDNNLIAAFSSVAKDIFPETDPDTILIEHPFFHLITDGFWFLKVKPEKESVFKKYCDSPNMRLTLRRLLETVESGYLDEGVDAYLRDPEGNANVQAYLYRELTTISTPRLAKPRGSVSDELEPNSLFAHEAAALKAIRRHVESHKLGEVLTNLELHDPQSNRYFETDLVVVSRFGIYVVELKHWSGRIDIRPNSWLQNGSFFKPDPHKANNFKAKLLKGLCECRFPMFPSMYFESVVILTNPEVTADGCSIPTTKANNPTFENIDRFIQYLRNQQKEKGPRLTELQCQAFVNYVRKLHTTAPPRDFVFPGYEIVERLYQYGDRAEVVAKRTDIRHRRLSRLRIFYPPAGEEKDRLLAHERATATLNAVTKIGDNQNVLKVWDIPNENNYIVEGSDWSETGTLRDVLEREGPLSVDRATVIAVGLTQGLDAVHKQYVVHRALSPENVLMVDDTPKLMNFDLSFQLEDDRVTVIPDAAKLKRTPYIAPEIFEGGTPEATADLFSLGVILYEMLAGKPPFGCSTDLAHSNGTLTDANRQKLLQYHVPARLVNLLYDLVRKDPRSRPSEATKVLIRLESDREILPAFHEANPRLVPGASCGLYAIEEFIKDGAEAQIYRAVGARGRQVALKLFNRDVALQRVVDEQRFAAAIHHSSIVRVDTYNQWNDGRYYISFDWVSGRSLRDEIVAGVRFDMDRFFRVSNQILKALAALHQNTEEGYSSPILHNDIKPENIMLGEGDRPVLVDFGAASEPHVGTYEGTEGYVAPDLRLGQDRKYSEDGDLYALAVTLHEWLIGSRLGGEMGAAEGVPAAILDWVNKGSAADAAQRFASANHMRDALQAAMLQGETTQIPAPVEMTSEISSVAVESVSKVPERLQVLPIEGVDPNPFVPYLNSLHSRDAGAENALAEFQALNPFFGCIHVPHPLVNTIQKILLGSTKHHIILTGHAGDGKSTIAVELFKQFSGLSIEQTLSRPLKKREDLTIEGKAISLVKDFSDGSNAERTTLMAELLNTKSSRFFLISNTGTMLDAFKAHEKASGGDWIRIESDLLGAMNTSWPSNIQFHGVSFSVINIAMIDNLGIAERIFQRMLAPERWSDCASAECQLRCPIYRNVSLIQQNMAVVRERLFLAYRRMYEYGIRLTMRQLCAHMAYMITSGLSYRDVVKMSQRASPPLMAEFMFFNRFFGDNGKDVDEPAMQLRAVRGVRIQGFGSQPCPTWERKLWLQSHGNTFALAAAKCPDDFEVLRIYGAGLQLDDVMTGAQAREQIRRAVFFLHRFAEGDDGGFLKAFLKSIMLLDFSSWQIQEGETLSLQDASSLHRRIMHVLQEHFTGIRLPEGMASDRNLFVTLSRRSHDVRQSAQVVLARYPEDDFQVRLRTVDDCTGGIRRELILEGKGSAAGLSLPLSLPFLDYVILRNKGEVGKDLQASYVDRLERLKGQLIRRSSSKRGGDIMLIRLRTNHTFRRQIFAVRGNRLEVTDG